MKCPLLSDMFPGRGPGSESEENPKITAICAMTGPQSHRVFTACAIPSGGSQRQRIHQPPEDDGCRDEPAEHDGAGAELRARIVAQQHRKDERHEEREEHQQREVAGHFLPFAMSNASSTTSELRSPATIRNVFPAS